MSKEIPIIRMSYEGEDAFPQTHTEGVIGLEDLIESIVTQYIRSDLIVQAPTGQKFKIVVDDKGVLTTERMEG
ncbi:hypothetical protein [Staphylococcus carnosus]|uniref:Uncharacterized protein n=1 Tax=Staphylococcus carnosus (strain TM300) TaxID=396513 RepID=B9DJC4_STACT|nr:hypothetical protein [Staphylococcus carnosus]QPT03602.1 hypothetical protein I6G40_11050 [Staphylococcus carnosus]UQA66325.1 hypothetical protein Sta3580_07085 [Staphylococcus carnosus]UTB78840.1 hypothetical protein A2I62_09845 [Staphylococcus carnosus]UTB88390.1 hypothetical protein A2I63_09835 [Staphylococcus carnosus]UTB90741.1 hypothetical protein A2I64_09840 [Staphylococcus carnosus]